jgi:Uncharacterized low-complexity proteins
MVSAGAIHSIALKSDNTVWSWGHNYYGMLGIGSGPDRAIPDLVLIDLGGSASVTTNEDMAITKTYTITDVIMMQLETARRIPKKSQLAQADLQEIDLEAANMHQANLQEADLTRANLVNTLLQGANIDKAVLKETVFESGDAAEQLEHPPQEEPHIVDDIADTLEIDDDDDDTIDLSIDDADETDHSPEETDWYPSTAPVGDCANIDTGSGSLLANETVPVT